MRLLEKLKALHKARQSHQEVEEILRQAIAAKRRSIAAKEQLVEIMDMLIINSINLIESLEFAEKQTHPPSASGQYKYYDYGKQGVSELIRFFEDTPQSKLNPREQ